MHVVAEEAALRARDARDPEPGAAPEPGLAGGGAAGERGQERKGHDPARPHDLVEAGQIELELDHRAGVRRVELALDPEPGLGEVTDGGVADVA